MGTSIDFSLLLNVLTTVAVVGGVIFGAWQVREAATARSTAVTLQLLQMLHNHDLTEGLVALMDAPTGLGDAELRQRLGDKWGKSFHAVIMLDGLGLLVHRGEVSASLAADFFKHSVAIAWDRFESAARDMRKQQTDTAFEWLQWLAESQSKRSEISKEPAHSGAAVSGQR